MDRLRLDAIKVTQGKYEFFLFTIDARTLLRVAVVRRRADDPLTGIQRMLDKSRLKEIGALINNEKVAFPNSLVVRLPEDVTFDDRTKILEIPDRRESVFVIDGQHRLWSFGEDYSNKNLDLPVSGFIGLDDSGAASIFVMINGTQRKINPSLVYDLFPLMRDTDIFEFEDRRAQSLVQALYSEEASPWFHNVSMLGGREFLITQASFVSNIKTLFKRDGAFTWPGLQDEAIQKELLFKFFETIAKVFKNAWLDDRYILCKNTGVGSLIRLMNKFLAKLRAEGKELSNEKDLTVNFDAFESILQKIPERQFYREEVAQEFLGQAGITRFSNKLASMVGLE